MANNTMWYAVTTVSDGTILLNFNALTRVANDGPLSIRIYGPDIAAGYQVYSFLDNTERNDVFGKLTKILNSININKLPPQTD